MWVAMFHLFQPFTNLSTKDLFLTNEVGIYNDYQKNEQHCKQNNETDHTVLNNGSFPLNSEYFAMQEHTDTFTL